MNKLLVILALITVAAAFQLPNSTSDVTTMFKGMGATSSTESNPVAALAGLIFAIPLLLCFTICLPCFAITYVICCPCCTVICFCYILCMRFVLTILN